MICNKFPSLNTGVTGINYDYFNHLFSLKTKQRNKCTHMDNDAQTYTQTHFYFLKVELKINFTF